jgi:alpha-glucoside transport system permease protein
VGRLDNYAFVFRTPAMLRSIRNTVGWMVVVPTGAVIGLVFAVLADKLRAASRSPSR